jgi:PhnB protein
MTPTTYLFFSGNCAEAMKFYQSLLGGKLEIMTYGEQPGGELPKHVDPSQVMHAALTLPGGGEIFASDDMSGAPYEGMHGFAVALNPKTAGEARKLFDPLSQHGQVHMPLEATFWSSAFAMFVDRFGTPWIISADPVQQA